MSLLDALKEENFGEIGNYSSLLPHFLMIESASLFPFKNTLLLFPTFPLRWRIEVVEAQMEDSVSPFRRGSDIVWHCYLCSLLIEISISRPYMHMIMNLLSMDVVVFGGTCWIYIC